VREGTRLIRLYDLAARVGVHPTNLGGVLNERRTLTRELADRIVRALEQEAAGR
jgi:plasmid maintenance system antidote protein VapI